MSTSASSDRRALGRFGETFAAQYLERSLGWHVVERNWRCRWGELDIIARDGDTCVIVEVRARRGDRYGSALESVDQTKLWRLMRLAPMVLRDHGGDDGSLVRFDVIGLAVEQTRVRTITHVRHVLDGL